VSALETPEAMAEDMVARIVRGELSPSMALAIERAIRARDEQVAALATAKAAEAEAQEVRAREGAAACDESGRNYWTSLADRREGEADAYRAIAATLRGAR
jgi:hypothetical protein